MYIQYNENKHKSWIRQPKIEEVTNADTGKKVSLTFYKEQIDLKERTNRLGVGILYTFLYALALFKILPIIAYRLFNGDWGLQTLGNQFSKVIERGNIAVEASDPNFRGFNNYLFDKNNPDAVEKGYVLPREAS